MIITWFPQTMHFAVSDTGALTLCSPWLPSVVFTEAFLAAADNRRVIVRGDEVEVRCTNGGATYALSPVEHGSGCRAGTLLRAWGP